MSIVVTVPDSLVDLDQKANFQTIEATNLERTDLGEAENVEDADQW